MRSAFLILLCAPAIAAAQTLPPAPQTGSVANVRRLTVEEAVRLALQNNLGVQIARIDPAVQDLQVAQARAAWFPTFNTTLQAASTDTPSNSFLSGAQGPKTSDDRFGTDVGVGQTLPWGGSYTLGWDSSRSKTTNIFSNFSPQLRSSLSLNYSQPLLRGFSIDTPRQQLLISQKNRDITTPPIDVVEAEAEVARREEAVILAEAQIATAEDALRALVYDPSAADFWTLRFEPISVRSFEARMFDGKAAVQRALANRTDLQQSHKNIEATDINLRYYRNQTLPDLTASVDYGVTGLGGTQFVRGSGFPGPIVGQTERGFGAVLNDLFVNDFPAWTASLTVSYPIGPTPQEATLARTGLEYSQRQIELRNQELLIATEIRGVTRQALTNQKRVETTRIARTLTERRLEAEQRKFDAGTSTSFLVFQAQRDLAQARAGELRAILDYNRSIVDFETVQEAPLR